MRVLVNRKPRRNTPWGGGNLFLTALCDTLVDAGIDVDHTFSEKIDVIFIQDPRYDELGISINEIASYKRFNSGARLIHRVNECDSRKATQGVDRLLSECSRYCDHTIFVSEWMKKYHEEKAWFCCNTSVIHNGVNRDHFSGKEKIKNGKVNIVAHHWSNNRLKGFDIYEDLDRLVGKDDNFTFTYIGRHNETFKNTTIINPLYGESLGRELSKYDVYVSGSINDPGPNHILESISCGLPTYVISTGGGAVEFAGSSHTYESFEDLHRILKSREYQKNKYTPISWKECIDSYIKIIKMENTCQK